DIAYSVHDLEDFWKVGVIPLARLVNEDRYREEFLKETSKHWWNGEGSEADALAEMARTARELFEFLPSTMKEPFDGRARQRAEVRKWTSFLIGRYVRDAVSLITGPRVSIEPQAIQEIALLKTFTRRYAVLNATLSAQ